MPDLVRDETLDALVRELNSAEGRGADAVRGGAEGRSDGTVSDHRAPRVELGEGDALERVLAAAVSRRATDVLLLPGSPPVLRVNGKLVTASEVPLDEDEIRALLAPFVGPAGWRALRRHGATDFSVRLVAKTGEGAWRFRANVHRQRGRLAVAVRALPREIPTLASLNLPASLSDLVRPSRGLVLLCGPTGSGKTSTLAALVGELNRTRACHVVTIEDPVEYEHPNRAGFVEQIEVGTDSPSFAAALKASLRQNPDVIVVGEMRDLESISMALTAAETGHLVLSTLHTNDVPQSIHRLVDVFPAEQQGQVRLQLALALHAIVCQQLVPRADGGGRLPAIEVLVATPAVRHHIRKQAVQNLYNEIALGKRSGMIAMEESLGRLVRSGLVTREEAEIRASHPEALEGYLRG
jgi:twitching motility protein PilT